MTKVYTENRVYQSVANYNAYHRPISSYHEPQFPKMTMKEKTIHLLIVFLFMFILMPGLILLFFHWLGT